MAGTVSAGTIIYDVDMDTAGILRGRRDIDAALSGLNGSMGRLEASVNRTERSIGSMERTMSSLSGVAKGLIAALSVQQVASYADAWTELNNKISNSIRTGETQAEVMQRIFDISQATQSTLNGTATLYSRLERSTRTYNTSAEDLARLTTIINQGFAVSGATAQEAENAIIQLSQGIDSGVLRGEEFNSVSEQGSRLMIALADSAGVTIGQLRKMAAEGKLTTDVVVNGLLSQGDAIGKEFEKTTVSIAKGLQVAGNNVTKFFGENSTVKSFAAGFRDSVVTISENLEGLGAGLIGVAAIMGGRFVGAVAMATAAQATKLKGTIQGIIATRQAAQQEAAAASVTARKAAADKSAALSALNLATAEYNVAKGSAAEAIALENVIRLRAIYVATSAEAALANNALSASQARVAATGLTMANAWKAVTMATAPLGGPLGAIAIVAAGWYLYSQRQAEARKEAIAFADTIPEVIKRLNDMNLAQAQGVRADTVDSIKAQKESIDDLGSSISELEADYDKYATLAKQYGVTEDENNGYVIKAKEAANELAKARRDLDGQTAKLKQTESALNLINIQVNQGVVDQMKAARDNAAALAEAEKKASFLGSAQGFLAGKLGEATTAMKAFNAESLKIDWGGKEGEKLIKQAERRLALSKLEGEAKARQQAAYDAEDAGVNDERAIKRLQDRYAATERVTQARNDQKKEDKDAESAAKKSANATESITQKLNNLREQSELASQSTQELSRERALLRAEESLGKNASADQIKQARDYTAAIWDSAAAIKARNAIPELKENADYTAQKSQLEVLKAAKDAQGNLIISQEQYSHASEQIEKEHQANIAKIRSSQAAGVSPMDEARGSIDPVQRLANQHAQELAMIQQFETQKGQITQRGLELMNVANTQYEQERLAAQWEIFRNQDQANELLATSLEGLQSGASSALTGLINGTQSLQEAFANIGSTILNSVVSALVEMGVQWVKSQLMGQAANQAAIVSNQAMATAALAASTATGVASAATLLAAWSPAAMAASVASYGGASAAGMAGYTAAMASAKTMSIAGAREHGGPVSASSMYRVGEGGKPEIFRASNGSQYMIPGDNGKVISNRDMQGGGGGSSVVQHISFEINTTGGIDQASIKEMEGMMKRVALFQISDQANRPGGLIQPRTKR